MASTSTRDGQPFKAQPQGWLMYVVHTDTNWPVLVAGVGASGGALRAAGRMALSRPRHSYRTWLVSDGVPINVVSRLMGHEQISTTLNRYTHDARDYADLRVRAVFAGLAADDLLTSGES